jgi:hypothetical protein
MAAFTEKQKTLIRDALGFSAIFLQSDPRLETAINSICAVVDGGTRPDDSSQMEAMSIVDEIQSIYCELRAARKQVTVTGVNKIQIDAARGIIMLRSEGRRLVTRLSAILSTNPRRDIFSASSPALDQRFADPDAFGDAPGGEILRRG